LAFAVHRKSISRSRLYADSFWIWIKPAAAASAAEDKFNFNDLQTDLL